MGTNKIIFGGTTLLDLSEDTVTPSDMLEGVTAHDRSGAPITGTLIGVPASTTAPLMDGTAATGSENAYARGDHVHPTDATLQAQIDALGEPFRVKNWASNTLNVEIPTCTEDIANTNIAKMTFTITGQEATDYQVVGMIAYEVFDAASGGARINCWPVCQFTGQGQTELSVRWMCAGTSRKIAKRINAWVLLKHR